MRNSAGRDAYGRDRDAYEREYGQARAQADAYVDAWIDASTPRASKWLFLPIVLGFLSFLAGIAVFVYANVSWRPPMDSPDFMKPAPGIEYAGILVFGGFGLALCGILGFIVSVLLRRGRGRGGRGPYPR